MNTNITPPTPRHADTAYVVGNEHMLDALIERELQQQEMLRLRISHLAKRNEMMRRRRQTTIVATLINVTSVAALIALAFVWQFYFPMAQAVAAILP
ncbi:MAG: hypothetical protein IJS59_03280 [Bacteroidaceae bacterium]|nr:hypothetical protein [Bacteroidaceae bacterium]